MSTDEDFSLITEDQNTSKDSLENVKEQANNYKKKCEQLQREIKEMAAERDDQHQMAEKFRQRTEKINKDIEVEARSHEKQMKKKKAEVEALKREEAELMEEIERVMEALKEEEAQQKILKQQTDVFKAVPERPVYFNGMTAEASDKPAFDVDAKINYPMLGGTALITFEDEAVAKKILDMEKHRVELGEECRIIVEAKPVHLMVPKLVEIDSEVCPRRILISNLPRMDAETLLNKLEIHFSKTKNGGGEVEECEIMSDSWTVVITFMKSDVAKGLTVTENHEVTLQKKKHKVRVTPFLNGTISNLKTEMLMCPRTVLLTGIPDVMERETLQDLLEIHFQKSSNGGGEIEAFLYNPLGQHITALFDSTPQNGEEE